MQRVIVWWEVIIAVAPLALVGAMVADQRWHRGMPMATQARRSTR